MTIAVVVVTACEAPATSSHPDPRSAPPRAQRNAALPGPTHAAVVPGRGALNDDCARCHPEHAAEWIASQHRTAHSDPDYQRAVARERGEFCQSCHAPEASAGHAPTATQAALGVACVTCHLPAGAEAVLAAPGASAHDGHDSFASAEFASVGACAGCHEFAFPFNPTVAMQATVTEHAASPFADTPCADCHMPWTGQGETRHRDHSFAASRDPAMLRAAVDVEAKRGSAGEIALTLTPGRIGHAFPTGDLFRRLWIDVEAIDDNGDGVAYDGRALGRRFTRSGGHLLEDDRPGAPALRASDGAVEVAFTLGESADLLPIRWRVVHQRVDLPLDGDDAQLFGETLVVSGELPPGTTKP